MNAPAPTQDASAKHWIYRLPKGWIPYAQLSRLDRPVGYWLLALPGWMGLAFAGLNYGLSPKDLIWAVLILIGAIAMRGAGCTYNDIIDRDLDAKVARTSLRPIPARSVTVKQAKLWMFAQIGMGFLVWLCLPLFAKFIAFLSLPLVAAYPFMKRITWWPQLWLGLTFNWAFLVAVAIKTGAISLPSLVFYLGLICWTVGYDTIYALQDVEDDALIGVKSTARKFGKFSKLNIGLFYGFAFTLMSASILIEQILLWEIIPLENRQPDSFYKLAEPEVYFLFSIPFATHLLWQVITVKPENTTNCLFRFKSNWLAAILIIMGILLFRYNTILPIAD